jgi:hypothetical protein
VTVVVSEDENPFPFERRSESLKTHHGRPAGVACSFQVREDLVSAFILEVRNVLNEDPMGSEFSNDAGVFKPETASLKESALFASGCSAKVLAGEAAADEVNWLEVVLADVFNVGEFWDIGPPFGEDFIAKGVFLNLPHGLKPGPFQTEVNAANAREKAAMSQTHEP